MSEITYKEYCPIPSCPGRVEITNLQSENLRLQRVNDELNVSLTNLKQLLEVKPTDDKVKEVITSNIELRSLLSSKERELVVAKSNIYALDYENKKVKQNLSDRENRDLELIKEINQAETKAQVQIRGLRDNEQKIAQQELQLKALKEFIEEARSRVKELEEKHGFFVKESRFNHKNVKRVVKLCNKIQSLKSGTKNPFKVMLRGNPDKKSIKLYDKLKNLYFNLNTAERGEVGVIFDKTSEVMGK